MNKAQARHASSMAKKIKMHASSIIGRMNAIEYECAHTEAEDVPVENVEQIFNELEADWQAIQSVLNEMLPELKEQ